jgi:hypothetical protein
MTKAAYLKELVEHVKIYSRSLYLDKANTDKDVKTYGKAETLQALSPPSLFIGCYGYPYVYAGPLINENMKPCYLYDMPELWLHKNINQEQIIKFRLSLIRGKKKVKINERTRFIEKLQELALSLKEPYTEVITSKPFRKGIDVNAFNEDHEPYGLSTEIKDFYVGNNYWNKKLEKFYYDTDLDSRTALKELLYDNVPFSVITKAFSAGCFGIEKNRKIVPTRWAITAVDKNLGDILLENVKHYELIDRYLVFESHALFNSYYVLLVPSYWQYEWFEAFLHIIGKEELLFNDAEFHKKNEYSSVGGCFYTCRFAVLEALERMKKQAGCFVFREAYKGYVPLGVFNVRECVRKAMSNEPKEFDTINEALNYISSKLKLPFDRYLKKSLLLSHYLSKRQRGIAYYL